MQSETEKAVSLLLKDAKVIEIETTQAIVSRLTDWAKLFGFLVGIPLALLVTVLSFLGIRTYRDFSSRVRNAKEEALTPLEQTKAEAKRIAQAYKDLNAQLEQTSALASQVQALSQKVARIEQVVRFKPSASLTPELKENLEQSFRNFYTYLKSVGFSLAHPPPSVSIDPSVETNCYYEQPPKNKIVMSPDLAPYADCALREYIHHVLIDLKPKGFLPASNGLESGLADYFPSSFNKSSDFGREMWKVFQKRYPGVQIPTRNLENHRSFSEIRRGQTEYHDEGNVWGGAFWELRQTIGDMTSDKLLLAAWKDLDLSRFAADTKTFPREILKQDSALEGGKHLQQIRDVFQRRGLEL